MTNLLNGSALARISPSALALVFALGVGSAYVLAAGNGSVPVLVPYTGHLDESGLPVNNVARAMTFTIFDDATAGTALSADAFIVSPSNGLFSVVLGAGSDPLETDEIDAATLFLEVKVEGTAIGARQQIYAALQSVRADSASNFTVHGVLTAAGGADVTGGLVADDVSIPDGGCMALTAANGTQFNLCSSDADGVTLAPNSAAFLGTAFTATGANGARLQVRNGTVRMDAGTGATTASFSLGSGGATLTDQTRVTDLEVQGLFRIRNTGATAPNADVAARIYTKGSCSVQGELNLEPVVDGGTSRDALCYCGNFGGSLITRCIGFAG